MNSDICNNKTNFHSNTYLSKEYIGQSHGECVYTSDFRVILTNEKTAVKTQVIDQDGNICNFPGIESCEALCAEMNVDRIRPVIAYSAAFKKCENGQHMMIWTVRPDGRYWMDSWGFGAEDYESVELYSYIDENGQFTAPFRLYSIGYCKFYEEKKG